MRFIKTLKSKRGIAIENAILFMLIIFSLCTLLSGLTLVGQSRLRLDNILLKQDIEIEQLGEDFIYYLQHRGTVTDNDEYEEYDVNIDKDKTYQLSTEGGNPTFTVRHGDTVVLYIEATVDDGNNVSIKTWRYSEP